MQRHGHDIQEYGKCHCIIVNCHDFHFVNNNNIFVVTFVVTATVISIPSMVPSSVFRGHVHGHDRHCRQHHHQTQHHPTATTILGDDVDLQLKRDHEDV